MAYRGGNINITIKGDSSWDLDKNDFKVLVYPDRRFEDALSVDKSEMTKIGDNQYLAVIAWQKTKTMKTGPYTIEILIFEGENIRSVFMKESADHLYSSASTYIP